MPFTFTFTTEFREISTNARMSPRASGGSQCRDAMAKASPRGELGYLPATPGADLALDAALEAAKAMLAEDEDGDVTTVSRAACYEACVLAYLQHDLAVAEAIEAALAAQEA